MKTARRVTRLRERLAETGRFGPVDVVLAAFDVARTARAKHLVEAGLVATAHRGEPDHALLEKLRALNAAREGIASHRPEVRQQAIRLEVTSGSEFLDVEVVESALADKDLGPAIAEDLAARVVGPQGLHRSTVETLLRQHSTDPAFAAACLLLGATAGLAPRVRRWAAGVDATELPRTLKRLRRAEGAVAALRLASEISLRRAVITRLRDAASDAELKVLLANAHLALARPWAFEEAAALEAWSTTATDDLAVRRGSILVCRSTARSIPRVHEETLRGMSDPDEVTRVLAVSVAPRSVVSDYAFDRSPRVATSASLRRSQIGTGVLAPAPEAADRYTKLLTQSPHARVRRLAQDEPGIDAVSTWHRHPGRAAAMLRQELNDDPEPARSRIRDLLLPEDADPEFVNTDRSWFTAAGLIARTGVADLFEHDLIEVLRRTLARNEAPSNRRAATAISLLASVRTKRSRVAITIGLKHPDPRVRANAVESAKSLGKLTSDLTDDAHHRVRANVACFEAKHGNTQHAVEGLTRLIGSADRLPQLAGLWAFTRVAPVITGASSSPVAEHVNALAHESDDPQIAARARIATRRVMLEAKPIRDQRVAA